MTISLCKNMFERTWVAKPSTSRRQFLLFAAACRSAAAARERGVSQQVACENFLEDMRRACRNDKHRRLIGVSRAAACRRAREGLGGRQGRSDKGKKSVTERVRDMLLESLKAVHLPGQGRRQCPPGMRMRGGRCVQVRKPKQGPNDLTVDDLATEGGLLSPQQGPEKCPPGKVREPITGRCVPKRRPR